MRLPLASSGRINSHLSSEELVSVGMGGVMRF